MAQNIRQYEFVAGMGWKERLYERVLIAIVQSGATIHNVAFYPVGMFSRKCVLQVTGRTDEFHKQLPSITAHPAEYGISAKEVLVTASI